jgi:hypothetical protein
MGIPVPSKPRGKNEVAHWIKVPGLSHAADGLTLERALMALAGVINVQCQVEKKRIRVRYTQTSRDFYSILEKLELTGFPASTDWRSRQTRRLFQYLDNSVKTGLNKQHTRQ